MNLGNSGAEAGGERHEQYCHGGERELHHQSLISSARTVTLAAARSPLMYFSKICARRSSKSMRLTWALSASSHGRTAVSLMMWKPNCERTIPLSLPGVFSFTAVS